MDRTPGKDTGWSRKWIEVLDLRLETYRLTKKVNLIKLKNPEKVAIPIRDSQGNLVNIRLYHQGATQYKMISFARSTSSSTLFPAKPFIDDKPVLLVEGETDTICALSRGFNAKGPQAISAYIIGDISYGCDYMPEDAYSIDRHWTVMKNGQEVSCYEIFNGELRAWYVPDPRVTRGEFHITANIKIYNQPSMGPWSDWISKVEYPNCDPDWRP